MTRRVPCDPVLGQRAVPPWQPARRRRPVAQLERKCWPARWLACCLPVRLTSGWMVQCWLAYQALWRRWFTCCWQTGCRLVRSRLARSALVRCLPVLRGPVRHRLVRRRLARCRGDAGSGAVWVLAVSLVAVLVAALFAARGAAVVARHRAAAAADFAALAGATRAIDGGSDACALAQEIASRNGAELVRCSVSGAIVEVETEVPLPGALGRWSATGTARAGPVAGQVQTPRLQRGKETRELVVRPSAGPRDLWCRSRCPVRSYRGQRRSG